jgi:protein gp37/ParB-like chromosome segregation protein Spo0J
MQKLTIDSEFQNLIPKLTTEEYTELENSILIHGCLDTIKVWNDIIVDGHNRYELCQKHSIEFDTKAMEFDSKDNAKIWIINNQLGRRNLPVFVKIELKLKSDEIQGLLDKAKKNQSLVGGDRKSEDYKSLFQTSEKVIDPINATKEIARATDTSIDTVAKAKKIIEQSSPEIIQSIRDGDLTINKAYTEIKEQEKELKQSESKPTFNATNDSIDWAKWSWNPQTGCLHDCEYCYARDIANRFYKEKFEPTFRPERLRAPFDTTIPKTRIVEIGINNVFVCSMADLFGSWVPQENIDKILKVVKDTPQWNYIFLTKNPKRLVGINFPVNAWVGATVDCQGRVEATEKAFENVNASVKFLSCEPLQEPLVFTHLELFDWIIIGGRSKSISCPEFQPHFEWVENLISQARKANCKVYCKPNLNPIFPKEYPEGGVA